MRNNDAFETQLDQRLTYQWKLFEKKINSRLTGRYDLSWCLSNGDVYKDGYYSLSEYYEKPHQYILTCLFKYFRPSLWCRFAWPHFIDKAIQVLERDYFQALKWNDNPKFIETKSFFLSKIKSLSAQVSPIILESVMSDFLNVMGYSVLAYYSLLKQESDIFSEHKYQQNKTCLFLYEQLRQEVFSRSDVFALLLFLSVRSNWIDSFEHGADSFLKGFPSEVDEIMNVSDLASVIAPFLGYFDLHPVYQFFKEGETKHVLYELDNSGEIYFDLLLVEQLLRMGHRVTLVAKESPYLNDVTLKDLGIIFESPVFEWMTPYRNLSVLNCIHNGSSMPGKSLFLVSGEYKKAYELADIIFLKGQGNFETMPMGYLRGSSFLPFQYKKPLVYILGVKSSLVQYSMKRLFKQKKLPYLQSSFVYFFDSKNTLTYPK